MFKLAAQHFLVWKGLWRAMEVEEKNQNLKYKQGRLGRVCLVGKRYPVHVYFLLWFQKLHQKSYFEGFTEGNKLFGPER